LILRFFLTLSNIITLVHFDVHYSYTYVSRNLFTRKMTLIFAVRDFSNHDQNSTSALGHSTCFVLSSCDEIPPIGVFI
jgi:hypothetical protein